MKKFSFKKFRFASASFVNSLLRNFFATAIVHFLPYVYVYAASPITIIALPFFISNLDLTMS